MIKSLLKLIWGAVKARLAGKSAGEWAQEIVLILKRLEAVEAKINSQPGTEEGTASGAPTIENPSPKGDKQSKIQNGNGEEEKR